MLASIARNRHWLIRLWAFEVLLTIPAYGSDIGIEKNRIHFGSVVDLNGDTKRHNCLPEVLGHRRFLPFSYLGAAMVAPIEGLVPNGFYH